MAGGDKAADQSVRHPGAPAGAEPRKHSGGRVGAIRPKPTHPNLVSLATLMERFDLGERQTKELLVHLGIQPFTGSQKLPIYHWPTIEAAIARKSLVPATAKREDVHFVQRARVAR
jgi:hypothetical protein